MQQLLLVVKSGIGIIGEEGFHCTPTNNWSKKEGGRTAGGGFAIRQSKYANFFLVCAIARTVREQLSNCQVTARF